MDLFCNSNKVVEGSVKSVPMSSNYIRAMLADALGPLSLQLTTGSVDSSCQWLLQGGKFAHGWLIYLSV